MNCSNDERISAWIDGELSPEAARDLEAHLAGCEPCRGLAELWRAGDAAAQAPIEPPGWGRARARVLDEVRWPIRRLAPLSFAASALAAAAISLFVGRAPEPEAATMAFPNEPEKVLRAGEAMLMQLMEAPPERIEPIRSALAAADAADRLADMAAENAGNPEVAEGCEALRAVITRVNQMPDPAPSWEIAEVQNAIKASDALDRVREASRRMTR